MFTPSVIAQEQLLGHLRGNPPSARGDLSTVRRSEAGPEFRRAICDLTPAQAVRSRPASINTHVPEPFRRRHPMRLATITAAALLALVFAAAPSLAQNPTGNIPAPPAPAGNVQPGVPGNFQPGTQPGEFQAG